MRSQLVLLTGGVCAVASLVMATDMEPTAATRRVFVTSTKYNGNLGGLAGADAICQSHASAGGIANAAGFVAWLSDASTDAYCHVHGLSGKKVDNCGQPSLPVAAGPWVRVDGFPFAGAIDEMLGPTEQILAPAMLDELGVALDDWEGVWTSSDNLGVHTIGHPGDCESWTSAVDLGVLSTSGSVWATALAWTATGGARCDTIHHLLCIETGDALALPPYQSSGALAFVTSIAGSGDVSSWPEAGSATGLDAGDAICLHEAASAGLPASHSFVAWLSTTSVDAIDRLTRDGAWVRRDGVKIADSKADLSDGYLLAPLNVTADGEYLGSYAVWTGTLSNGRLAGSNCSDWSTTSDTGDRGKAPYANMAWTWYPGGSPCTNAVGRLYCFSNVELIFADDFELGNLSAWSTSAP